MPKSQGNGEQLILVLSGMTVRQRHLYLLRYARIWGRYWKRMEPLGKVPPHLQHLSKYERRRRRELKT